MEKLNFVCYESGRPSSGARFFSELCKILSRYSKISTSRPDVVLFNISSPIGQILKAKFRLAKIILRVDGLWFDRYTSHPLHGAKFIKKFAVIILKITGFKRYTSDILNFIDDNYKSFFKIWLSTHIVYQSEFSRMLHQRYFNKNSSIVINGARWNGDDFLLREYSRDERLIFCVIYSKASLKGIYESILFVMWLNNVKKCPSLIKIIGYDGNLPPHAPDNMKQLLFNSEYVQLFKKFDTYNSDVINTVRSCHLYLSLTRRDPCPNAIIECMSIGLPVVGIASGGVPEIVKDAGQLIPHDDWSEGFFIDHRFKTDLLQFEYESLFDAINNVLSNYEVFKSKVKSRFSDELDIEIAAKKYLDVITSICD